MSPRMRLQVGVTEVRFFAGSTNIWSLESLGEAKAWENIGSTYITSVGSLMLC